MSAVHIRWPALLSVLLLVLACGTSRQLAPSAESLADIAAQHEMEASEVISPVEVSDEMRVWLSEIVRESDPTLEQLRQILDQFQSKKGLHLEYVPGYTGTAREVFETQQYNCLSFSHLFIALARELDIEAYFLNVDTIQNFHKEGDLVVVSGHITAGYGHGKNRKILEFNVGPDVDYRTAQPITDLEALSMYYSNRGAELLRDGKNREAVRWLKLAVDLDPEYSDGWVNLGVSYRRVGQYDLAERSYRTALELDPDEYSAYHNLSTLLRIQGESDAAREILLLLDRRDNRDPYIYLALGDDAMSQGRLEEARRYYRRAQNLAPQPDTHAAMGLWALASGDRELAQRWLAKALEDGSEDYRVQELVRKLDSSSDS